MNISLIIVVAIIILYLIIKMCLRCDNEKKELLFLRISFLMLFIILIVRVPFSDMIGYLSTFYRINSIGLRNAFNSRLEEGFIFLMLLTGKISSSERFFMFIVDIITCIGPYYIIKNHSNNYLISLLLFVCIGTYSMQFYIIRQSIAITFLFISIKFVKENNFLKFILFVILATLFHRSAIFFLVVYPLSKLNKKVLIFSFIIFFCFLFVFKGFFYNIINYTFYQYYLGGTHDVVNEGYGKLLLFLLLFIFILLFYKKNDNIEKDNKIMLVLATICILFQVFSTQISIATRLANYYNIAFVILPSNIIIDLNDKNRKIMTVITIIIVIIYLLFIHPIKGYSTILPL